jgi:hypothetical protein
MMSCLVRMARWSASQTGEMPTCCFIHRTSIGPCLPREIKPLYHKKIKPLYLIDSLISSVFPRRTCDAVHRHHRRRDRSAAWDIR